ncbi:MAG: TlpA family protein disulfide reductase [Anaerolineae bacterium]|jgi:cytochrome c biogenesis protein CcmG/thiol:disulfide interchange protein DsbE|nr:TlpA family protein disulfide reductase [Anaerolineae bacterium]
MEIKIPGFEQDTPPAPRHGLTPGSIVLLIGVLAVIVVVGLQLARQHRGKPISGPAPTFSLPLYRSEALFDLTAHRGQVVVVNFWGSWCEPCREEAPILQQTALTYADRGVVVLGVGFRDTERAALGFIDQFGLTYLNGPDIGLRISDQYGVQSVPETFVIDPSGDVSAFFQGAVSEVALTAAIERALTGDPR